MKPIDALIVDDEPAARNALLHLLRQDPEIVLSRPCENGREAVRAIRAHHPELVFLDVQMPGLDGFGVLREIERKDLPVVVFVTAYDRHALHAFEVHAVDYLLKPFSDARFLEALTVAKTQVRQRRLGELGQQVAALISASPAAAPGPAGSADPPDSGLRDLEPLLIRVDGRIARVRTESIDWIDADGDSVRVRVGETSYPLRTSMDKLEQELDAMQFVRIHRSTIVNVERIRELRLCYPGEYVAVLHDGTTLKVSRNRRELLESRLGRKV
jgi:two-component system, LytTR family, response regulator